MHPIFNPEINLGNVLTALVLLVGLIYSAGKFWQRVEQCYTELLRLREDFRDHDTADDRRFQVIQESLVKLALSTDGPLNDRVSALERRIDQLAPLGEVSVRHVRPEHPEEIKQSHLVTGDPNL